MELEESSTPFEPVEDGRPKMLPIPPVYLVAIADVRLPARTGVEKSLNSFYVDVLRMDREEGEGVAYRTANVRLVFDLFEKLPEKQECRPLCVVVPILSEVVGRLLEKRMEYNRYPGLWTGSDRIALIDPAGNNIEITETGLLI